MMNPITAYANLNQANRRWVAMGAGAAAALVGGLPLLTPIAWGAAIADGAHFHRNEKMGLRIRAGALTLITATIGAALIPDPTTPAPTAVATPAPIEQVVEAPAATPAPVVVAEAPAPAPVAAPPVAPVYEYATIAAAEAEMCDAARQYRGDVAARYMNSDGARYEINEYAKYLAKNSPADTMNLIRTGKACYGF